jgi:dTDP-4-dehydrorhamnose reductase
MKIFIAGGTGFLGNEIHEKLIKKHNILIGSKKKQSNLKADISNKKFLNKIEKFNPDIIINCVALTNIDKCEKNKKLAYKTNVVVTKNLVFLSEKLNCKFIHISTDHLYDGQKTKNTEKTHKIINYYGLTKKIAEEISLKYKKSLILRTNFFGISNNGNSNLSWFFENLKEKRSINLISDIFFSPIHTSTLCKIINLIIKKEIYGIFNIGSADMISKEKFFLLISKILRIKLDYKLIKIKTLIKKYKFIKRPKLMAMNVSKFQKKFKIELPKINQEIEKLCNEYKNQ